MYQRRMVGHRIYDDEFTIYKASEQFGISVGSARDYMRLYRDTNHLPAKTSARGHKKTPTVKSENLQDLEAMTKEELIPEVIKAQIAEVRLKRLRGEGGWFGNSVRQQEYQVIMELSGEFPIKLLCDVMGIQRSSF